MTKIHTLEENAMKTTMRILALTVLLLAGSFSVFSQYTLLINLPILMGQSAIKAEITISLELSVEETWLNLEDNQILEDWMLIRENWIVNRYDIFTLADTDNEAEIVLEDWMLTDLSQEVSDTWDFLKEDIEAPLKVEDWMICKEPW